MNIHELYQLYLKYPSIQTDTRKLKSGDIFFALKGLNFNGNLFAKQALDASAAYAVIDEATYKVDDRCIVVEDVLSTLQKLATYHRQQLDMPIIAITGSNGKTTTKELITTVLQQAYTTYATEGNLNNHIGVPLTLLKIKTDAQIAVVEMGANHQKEIESYCKIALPTYGIITNCGKAHIEGFGGIEGVKKGKGELFDYLRTHKGTIFLNTDLEYLHDMAHDIAQQITYGTADAKYMGNATMDGTFLQVALPAYDITIHTHLVGKYNYPNVMAAVAVGLHFGVPITKIKNAIEAYNPDNSRSQWVQKGSNQIIMDAYNANPTSMRAAIENFAASGLPNKMLWLGGMKEMGQDELKEHTELVQLISRYLWADVILVGNEFKGLNNSYRWFATSQEASNEIQNHQPKAASILIKGSRGSKMELLLNVL